MEQLYNPNFKPTEFEGFRRQVGLNAFTLSPKNGESAHDGNASRQRKSKTEGNARSCLVATYLCDKIRSRDLYHYQSAIKLTKTMQEREHTLVELENNFD